MVELGIVTPVGRKGVEQRLAIVTDAGDERVPEVARACLWVMYIRHAVAWHASSHAAAKTFWRIDSSRLLGSLVVYLLAVSHGEQDKTDQRIVGDGRGE